MKPLLRLFTTLLILSASVPLWARGTAEKDFQEAQGKGNFSQSVDLTKLTPGQYNLLVRTKDAAGNVSFAGPYNFYYDPASDNPLITVANPAPDIRLGGPMNAVGVASAPKGVKTVEVQVDGGEWQTAQGQAFWSAPLNTRDLADGPHRLSVRGTDVNGLTGPVVTVPFQLDQVLPQFTLASHRSGQRVQGEIVLSGTLADGNGLAKLEYAVGQEKPALLPLQGDARALSRPFSFRLDTRKYADGPLVLSFRGVDGQGSEVRQAVLLYVDNTVPVLTVLSPAPGQGLHGKVRFAVQAEKTLGIQSLSARVGPKGAPVPMAVVPGNPFHWVDLDLPVTGSGTVPVVFEAVDTAGKTGSVTYLAVLNGDTDLPTVQLASDWSQGPVKAPWRITGSLKATDGPGGLAWTLNGGQEVLQPAGASFDFPLPGVQSGTNKLVLVPYDANSKRGKPVPVTFTAQLDAPKVFWEAVVLPDQEVPFRPGIAVAPDRKTKLRGSLSLPNPLKSALWSFGDGKEIPLTLPASGTLVPFVLPLPDDPPFGMVPVVLKAVDIYGQEAVGRTWVDVTNLARPQGSEGTAFADPRVGRTPLVITPDTPLRGSFVNGKVRSADLLTAKGTVPLSVLQVTHDDQSVTIKALKDGQFENVRLRVVSDRGRIYDTDLGTVMGDTAPPAIGLASPLSGTWVRENLRIDGQVTDTNGLAKLEWSIDDGRSWQALDPPAGTGGPFTRSFSLPGPDNMVNLLIRATDTAGRTGTVLTVVRRDTQAPSLDLFVPAFDSRTNGTVLAVGRLKDEGALQKAEVNLGKKTSPLPVDRPFVLTLDPAGGSGSVRASDWAGNTVELPLTWAPAPAAADAPAPRPEVQILWPRPDTKGLNGVVPVVGRIVGFSETPRVTVKGDATGDRMVDLTDGGFFSVDVDLTGLKNRTLAFSAAGAGKEVSSVSFTVPSDPASELPSARFLPQAEKPVLTGNVTASGWIGDSRGVVSWVSQLDAGEKKTVVPDASKAPVGTFLVDLGVPAPGPHKLTVTPVNALGREGPPAVTEFVSTIASGPVEFTSFDLGALLAVTKDSRVQGRIGSINPWKKVEIRFADLTQPDPWTGPFQPLPVAKAGEGSWTFDAPVPAGLPYSRVGVVVRGEDSLGQKVEGRTLFYRIWPKDTSQIADDEGVVFQDDRLDASGRFTSVPGQPLLGTFRGRPIKAAVLNPAVPNLNLTFEGRNLSLDAKEEGLYGPFVVAVTTVDNETFTSKPITFYADSSGPLIDWEVPLNADWIKDQVAVGGKVTDPSGVAFLEASVDGGVSWSALPVKNGRFDAVLPVPGPDGLTRLVLRAGDKGGHASADFRAVTKDNSAPAWTLVAPPASRKVNGHTTLVGTATDLNPIVSVEYSDDKKTFLPADGLGTFAFDLDFASYEKLPEAFWIRATDAAGNRAVTRLDVPLDQEADKPVVQIQSPAEGEVVRTDFNLGGMAFDDDGVQSLSWRLDGGPWLKLDGVDSFQIPIALNTLTDNEHTVEVQAQDLYGTKGNVYRSVFKVSLAAPDALLQTPEIDKTVSGIVGLVGASFDRNGVAGVELSLDNGLTWNKAELRPKETFLNQPGFDRSKGFTPAQRTEWEWRFDSRTLKDGTYLVMARTTDGYATPGLSTSLVNIDNQPPALTLTGPKDGDPVLDSLTLEGRSSDNIALVSLKAELRPIDSAQTNAKAVTGAAVLSQDLPVTPTFNQKWSLGTLTPGWYNLRLEARDAAGNSTYVARNVRIEGSSADKVELLYPQAGETLSGSFVLEGKVTSRTPVDKALVNFDGKIKVVVSVDAGGYFSVLLDPSVLGAGDHRLEVSVQQTPAVTLTSEPRKVRFETEGPWVRVTSHHSGAFVTQRPFLLGQAGWAWHDLAPDASADDKKADQAAREAHKVVLVEASLDNGKTFSPAQGTDSWKFRLESLALPDGPQPLVFRARFADGTSAVQRMLVTVDQTPPKVELLTNLENGRFNGSLEVAGFTEGKGEVAGVEVAVRQGDKSGYEVPQFVQGMYLDAHGLGATLWEAGLGLTFFQEAVKIQAQLGQTPELRYDGKTNRFWGTAAGAKLIASIAQLPAGYFFGPDWSWLSSSFGLGANFEQFSMNGNFLDFTSASPVMLGGVVLQWEAAKATLKDLSFFRSYSWYHEATVWFISSDVQAGAVWTYSMGFRLGLL